MKRNPIESSPEILAGMPVFAGTRVPVDTLFVYLEGGDSINEFVKDFPTVTKRQSIVVLEAAKAALLAPFA